MAVNTLYIFKTVPGKYKPGCYTTDPKKRFEFCAIPECSQFMTGEGRSGVFVVPGEILKTSTTPASTTTIKTTTTTTMPTTTTTTTTITTVITTTTTRTTTTTTTTTTSRKTTTTTTTTRTTTNSAETVGISSDGYFSQGKYLQETNINSFIIICIIFRLTNICQKLYKLSLDSAICGLSPFSEGTILYSNGEENVEASMGRIINGEVALQNSFPWQIRLHNSGDMCGGTLISSKVTV